MDVASPATAAAVELLRQAFLEGAGRTGYLARLGGEEAAVSPASLSRGTDSTIVEERGHFEYWEVCMVE